MFSRVGSLSQRRCKSRKPHPDVVLFALDAIKRGRSQRQHQNGQRERWREMFHVMSCTGRAIDKMGRSRSDGAGGHDQTPERLLNAESSRFHEPTLNGSFYLSILIHWSITGLAMCPIVPENNGQC